MSIHQTIREGRTRLKLSEQAFAELVGVSRGSVQQWEKEGGTAPARTRQLRVAQALGITVAELFGVADNNVSDGPSVKNSREYPLISWVQAGGWTDQCENFTTADIVEKRGCHKDLGPCGYVLRVHGDSMTAGPGSPYTFPEGILLYVNPDIEATPGRFVVVRREEEKQATFKKLVSVDSEYFLEAINPNWPKRYLKLKSGDEMCGVVMHAGFDMP